MMMMTATAAAVEFARAGGVQFFFGAPRGKLTSTAS